MADKKISALTGASTPLAGTEVLPIVQSGATVKVAVSDLTAGRSVSMSQLTASGVTLTPTSSLISTNSLDGSDNKLLYLTGGGAADPSRGSFILSYGNDFGGAGAGGNLDFVLGSGTGGYARFMDSAYATILTIASPNVTVSAGNLVIGTAAKGVNFTANTPAAGMTSQLLNWYEEGTWTPTQGGGMTVVGAYTSVGTYVRIGRQVTITGSAQGATSISTGANQLMCSGLPFAVVSTGCGALNGGGTYAGTIVPSGTVLYGTAIPATDTLYFTATYFV
jgi:hypothetical protein